MATMELSSTAPSPLGALIVDGPRRFPSRRCEARHLPIKATPSGATHLLCTAQQTFAAFLPPFPASLRCPGYIQHGFVGCWGA
jgi:hypothetical protein